MKVKKMMLLTLLFFSVSLMADEPKAIYRTNSLSLPMATTAAQEANKDCQKRGYSVAVAVVDRGGNVQTVLRDRFAGPHTVETAIRKAWTANSFRQATG